MQKIITGDPINFRQIDGIKTLDSGQWNRLVRGNDPFLQYEFLAALETHHCLDQHIGWHPRFVVAEMDGRLLAAIPLYIKDNSYGELVFDWDWASAHERFGLDYYPKMVVAIPYTPATGQRILALEDLDASIINGLIQTALALAEDQGMSSLHWLFTTEQDNQRLVDQGLFLRKGVQFHWRNKDYRDFDDYLSHLSSKKRKNIRRERRLVKAAGVEIEMVPGDQMSDSQWDCLQHFYTATFHRKSGTPTLTPGFFREVGRALADRMLTFFAVKAGRYIAASVMFASDDTLYGRHWGSAEFVDGLHFELCYYQGLDYCIKQGLARFEPGAQGEFKISRGFLPTATWSAHWIADKQLHDAIHTHVDKEARMMTDYMETLAEHSPFRLESS